MSRLDMYRIFLCDDCAAGAGERCEQPGCALWCMDVEPQKLKLHLGPGVTKLSDQEVASIYAAKWFREGGKA